MYIFVGDLEPPLDPEVQNYIEEFTNTIQNRQQMNGYAPNIQNDSAAGFAKRRLLYPTFFLKIYF